MEFQVWETNDDVDAGHGVNEIAFCKPGCDIKSDEMMEMPGKCGEGPPNEMTQEPENHPQGENGHAMMDCPDKLTHHAKEAATANDQGLSGEGESSG